MNDFLTIIALLFGSGVVATALRIGVKPYLDKFNAVAAQVLPNGGSSITDKINIIEGQTRSTQRAVETLAAKQKATIYLNDVPMFETDANGNCTFVNKAYQDITGLPFQSCLGEGWQHALHPDDFDRVVDGWARCMATGTEFIMDFRWVQSQTGMIYYVTCRATITRDLSKNPFGAVGAIEIKHTENPHI